MPLISLRNLNLAFGGPPLLENVCLQVDKGERIGLLGRNGTGKSSLLSLIAGETPPDSGVLERQQGLRVAYLPQEVPTGLQGTVFSVVANALRGPEGTLPGADHSPAATESDSWAAAPQVSQAISRLGLAPEARVEQLSGGMLRRVLLARALAREADILLLDEPTNHLDIEAIAWLEEFLLREGTTLIFVTHDRAFLERLATRIVEIDRGSLFDFSCSYTAFLERRDDLLRAEEQAQKRFDKKLAEEEAWIRKGIKARRTRNEGRVRALKRMREDRRQRRDQLGTAKLRLEEAGKSGRLVAELDHVSFSYDDRPIVRDLSLAVMRGDRIGIIGPNGAGKTTLLKLLLGQLLPQSGSTRLGTNLQTIYFDQLRGQLDPDRTVQQNLAGDQDTVLVAGRPRHVIGYLQDFLFTPDRARSPVRILSGGERNRLLLAKLFTREANLLVLDEPTNDLDLETLELLEELLAEFQGTIFLVSHDRVFLDRVVTSTLVFEEPGRVAEYVGGYEDWLRQRPAPKTQEALKSAKPRPTRERPRKLSFKERQELAELPQRIEALEAEQAELHQHLADPQLYRTAADRVVGLKQRLDELETTLEEYYHRWDELASQEDGP